MEKFQEWTGARVLFPRKSFSTRILNFSLRYVHAYPDTPMQASLYANYFGKSTRIIKRGDNQLFLFLFQNLL